MKKTILDPSFKYRPSHETNIRKTFERERKRLERERQRNDQERAEKVEPLRRIS